MIRTNIIFKMECLQMTNVCSVQCDQIGRFLKVLGNRLSCKISPNDWKVFGLFWKTSLLLKTALPTFLGNFWKNFATFFSKIWSHCSILPKAEKPRNNKVWAIYYCNSLCEVYLMLNTSNVMKINGGTQRLPYLGKCSVIEKEGCVWKKS